MNILPQIFDISQKNFIIDIMLYKFKEKLRVLLDKMLINSIQFRYENLIIETQSLINNLILEFLLVYFETIDSYFKNSNNRKKNYYINKSNVQRTIVTIFGTLTFSRTLYQNKHTGEYYFYLDDIVGLNSYKTYDSIVRGIIVEDSAITNSNLISSLRILDLKNYLKNSFSIPKQTIYKFKQEVKIRNVKYKEFPSNKSLYVMVDEKWIHQQDKYNPGKKKWIMSKCFVAFTGIERKGKRSRLIDRHVFITSSNYPWKEFINEIYSIYNFETINNINLLSDAGSWILAGAYELKLYSNNKITINTCEFHVKQKINRSTTDKDLRIKISDIIYNAQDKKAFIKQMDDLIDSKSTDSRKQKVTEYKNYILRHWKGIINMKNSLCKSSMEAHIQHCIASSFSSVPKAYSKNNIQNYLKQNELLLNGINIFKYFITTYNSSDDFIFDNEKEVGDFVAHHQTSNMPILSYKSSVSQVFHTLSY